MERIGDIIKRGYPTGNMGIPSHPPTPNLMPSLRPIKDIAESLNVNPGHTFEKFKKVPGGESLVEAFKAVIAGRRFIALVYGGVGNGKTHLLEASAIELYCQGKFTRVLSFASMLSTLRAAINNPEWSYDDILSRYCYCERLIIDDVGAGGSETDFGNRIIETIVCARYGRRLLTLMSTNQNIDTLPERVLSRLKDKSVSFLLFNKAKDYRPQIEKGELVPGY